jgi:predicted unusual protein kinase regulating ubiquinone biosynthesis (AarF/ABC1/UbiB family)
MRVLESAREAACEPLSARAVERALKDTWGRSVAKALDDFDPEPLAVRAAAQTHRGVSDGVPVAIRVRRPGLERAVRADLSLLDAVAAPLGAALPRADARELLRAIREQALDELDFEHEASTQRRVARAVRDVEGVAIPAAHPELCAEGVLVTDLLEGATLADGARPADPGAAARALIAVHVAAARWAGLALLDARPGHVVVLPGGGIGLLGTGVARPVDRARVDHAIAALGAVRDDDPGTFARAVSQAGVLPEAAARTAHGLARSALGPLADGPAPLDAAALKELSLRAFDIAPAAFALVPQADPHPDDLWLGRAAGQLVATLARLEATEDWPALVASSQAG